MRVKICGITTVADALAADLAGADAIGLIFFRGSKRYIELDTATSIAHSVSPYISINALFVDPTEAEVHRVLSQVPVSQIQFHGSESAVFCSQFARPYVKCVPVSSPSTMQKTMDEHQEARAYLFDTAVAGDYGGTGQSFDWTKMPKKNVGYRVLAGGLNTENVKKAIRIAQPDAVDVSSGVEAKPGIKDHDSVRRFVAAAKRAGEELLHDN